uniref:NAD kinase 1 n=1 Tax=Arundo donax TaxID=35708 RepID=A0A0A9FAI6_ARUDO
MRSSAVFPRGLCPRLVWWTRQLTSCEAYMKVSTGT